MEFQHGHITYKDVSIQAIRGPQNGIFGAVWHESWNKETKDMDFNGMVGCGVYGFEGEEWVGVMPSSVLFLKEALTHAVRTYNEEDIAEWMKGFHSEDPAKRDEFERHLRVRNSLRLS